MSFPFVDAHVHFWDPALLRYPWLSGQAAIAAAHRPAELRAELGARMPGHIVFVQAECDRDRSLDEVTWVERLALDEPRIAGVVAFAPMDAGPETARALDRLAGKSLVRGVRHLIQDAADPRLCSRPAFIAGVRSAGERDLSFDLCVRPGDLPAVAELVGACPGTRFVLDHAGKPDIRGGRLDPWRADVERLAALPHVACKLSGLVTEADPATWTPDDLRPYVDHLLVCFGPQRLLFGSDWPVVKLASGYGKWLASARALLEPLAPADLQAVFVDNARRIYRLP
jgi:L-fuconolactonase